MDYRIGSCSQCGAEYKVPASFAHDQARCKSCPGTVNLGPVQSSEAPGAKPAPVPAKKVVSKPKPMEEVQAQGAEEKRKERGTLAKLRAERAAAAKAAPSDAAKSAAAKSAAAKPAAAKPAAAKPVAAASATPRTKSSRPSRSSSKSSRSRGKSRGQEDSSEGKGRRGRSTPEKKKSPMGLIALVVIVLGGGFGAWKYLAAGADKPQDTQAAETVDAPLDNGAESADASMAEDSTADSAGSMDAPGSEAAADAEKAASVDAESSAEPTDATPAAAPKKDAVADLGSLERCSRARGTSDEEWDEMNGWLTDFLDLDAGAAGPRAGKKLANQGRKAMPILINGLLSLDYSTEEGINTGDTVQRMLKTIANGNSFGWWYVENPRAEYLCSGAAAAWQKAWKQVESNIEAFIKLAKLDREYEGDGDDPLGPLRAQRLAEAAQLRADYGSK